MKAETYLALYFGALACLAFLVVLVDRLVGWRRRTRTWREIARRRDVLR